MQVELFFIAMMGVDKLEGRLKTLRVSRLFQVVSHSVALSHASLFSSQSLSVTPPVLVLVVVMGSMELKTSRSLMLILCITHRIMRLGIY